ncbi:N-alpha-acetyltransferase 60 [Rhopalosiphum maidis]|uniref:N-alpha-acetyltransferase 60 n=1 Tax=Rhopalosiphum maidis TaxID=43146 RepID=UPI000EFF5FEE|nr:N-alpha-acetyltransferase 60 [Rhopalosiphum maidis]
MDTFNWYLEKTSTLQQIKPVGLYDLSNLQLRFLCPQDINEVNALCVDCFPVEYPRSWYEDITSNPKFYSLAAIHKSTIVGIIVAEIKLYIKLNPKEREVVSPSAGKFTQVGYILSLGVTKAYRRNGIASLLLDNLVSHLTSAESQNCKAIFLHVLSSNSSAISFYERKSFRLHSFHPYYYMINGINKDGFAYVLYINGGHQQWMIFDVLRYIYTTVCELGVVRWTISKARKAARRFWPRIRRIASQNTSTIMIDCS